MAGMAVLDTADDTRGDTDRVVVTGIGLVTPVGVGQEEFWESVSSGSSGLRAVTSMDTEGYGSRLGGEVKQGDVKWPETTDWSADRAIVFALAAARQAVEGGGIADRDIDPDRFGVVMGTCMGGMRSGEEWHRQLLQNAPDDVDHTLLLAYQFDSAANVISHEFRARGPKVTISTACAAGANAIGLAADFIRQGRADVMLAGGTEALAHIAYAGFTSLQSLSPSPCAPYSGGRDGLTLGEGAGFVVLETLASARARDAHVYAEVLGYGLSIDGYHPTAPHPDGRGAAQAIRTALENAGLAQTDIGYINGHGTGTPKNDSAETRAIHAAFGDTAFELAVSSTKSMLGHSLGAAGAIEGITTILALDRGFLPPTVGWRGPDPDLDLDYLPNNGKAVQVDAALSNSFAFGGNNVAVLYGRAGKDGHSRPAPTAHRRAVITGAGAVSAAGAGADAFWAAVRDGRSLLRARDSDREELPAWSAPVVDPDLEGYLTRRETRRMDTSSIWSVVTSKMAVQDAGLEIDDDNRGRIGVLVGIGSGPADAATSFHAPLVAEGPAGANPAIFPNTVFNAAGGQVAIHLGLHGATSTVTCERASSGTALSYAVDMIRQGQADALIVVGVEECNDVCLAGYAGLGATGERPQPFADSRDGFAPTGGAVAVVVESEEFARSRGAQIRAEITGFGLTSGAVPTGEFERSGDAVAAAISGAVKEADLEPGRITAVVASASGSVAADLSEARGIRTSLGDEVPVVAYKSLTGESWGCTGTFGVLVALGMIAERHIPAASTSPTRGAGCEVHLPADAATDVPVDHVVVNSVAGGGTNVAMVISRYAPADTGAEREEGLSS